jgi:5'-3' exonuclease
VGNVYAGPAHMMYQSVQTIYNRFTNPIFVLDGFPKWKYDIFPEYKANRQDRKKEDNYEQNKEIRKYLRNWVFTTLSTVVAMDLNNEADDCIGSLSTQCSEKGIKVNIVASDKDLWQLKVNPKVHIFKSSMDGFEEITEEHIKGEFGVTADKIPLYKSFFGDPSDNIPKVFGLPKKIGEPAVQAASSVEDLLARVDELIPKAKTKTTKNWAKEITDFGDKARVNYILAKIMTNLRVPFGYFGPELASLCQVFDSFGIKQSIDPVYLYNTVRSTQYDTLKLLVDNGLLDSNNILPIEAFIKV